MATTRQQAFIRDLMVQAGASREEADAADFSNVSVGQASQMIETLKQTVRERRNANGGGEPPEGIHFLPSEGERGTVLKVQRAVHGSGKLYAKRLVPPPPGGNARDGEWVYEGRNGAFRSLSEDTLMTLEDAQEYGHLYGVCCRCGALLTDEQSIADGIGPVCKTRF